MHLERPCYQPFGKSDPLGLKKPIVLFAIGDCSLRLDDFCVSPFCKLPALIPLILNEPAALSLGKTNPANLVLNAGAVELQGHVGSFVPHDDTFSIKSFSSLLHFSALGALLKCF